MWLFHSGCCPEDHSCLWTVWKFRKSRNYLGLRQACYQCFVIWCCLRFHHSELALIFDKELCAIHTNRDDLSCIKVFLDPTRLDNLQSWKPRSPVPGIWSSREALNLHRDLWFQKTNQLIRVYHEEQSQVSTHTLNKLSHCRKLRVGNHLACKMLRKALTRLHYQIQYNNPNRSHL